MRRPIDDDEEAGQDDDRTRFVAFGTALPPRSDPVEANKERAVWNQDVRLLGVPGRFNAQARDEQGRKRFHGAFTGGFSAGYHNTVGSEEGWTPSTFRSSRGERAAQPRARPEDFMDEEDKAAHRASVLQSMKPLDEVIAKKPDRLAWAAPSDTATTEDVLKSVMEPDRPDSAGDQILRKMGWRQGQGVGPLTLVKNAHGGYALRIAYFHLPVIFLCRQRTSVARLFSHIVVTAVWGTLWWRQSP
jgi:G patch domain-containing protein 1